MQNFIVVLMAFKRKTQKLANIRICYNLDTSPLTGLI